MEISLIQNEWYDSLVDELKDILVEAEFTSRWALVEGYHLLGTRLLKEYDNFERQKIYGQKITSAVAESLGKSTRTIERAVQFARMYPNLQMLPEGKNVSWNKIVTNYLTEGGAKEKKKKLCPRCGYQL